jgi:hypothetical protein
MDYYNQLWVIKESGKMKEYWDSLSQEEKKQVITVVLEGNWVGQCLKDFEACIEDFEITDEMIHDSMSDAEYLELVDDAGGWCNDCGWVYPSGELTSHDDENICWHCKENYSDDDDEDEE